jgi:spore maturation protein CgeB
MKTFFVAGDHYAEFTDLESAVDQVTWAIQYEQGWAKDMADAAYRKVQPHTYDARVAQILDRVGLRKAD